MTCFLKSFQKEKNYSSSLKVSVRSISDEETSTCKKLHNVYKKLRKTVHSSHKIPKNRRIRNCCAKDKYLARFHWFTIVSRQHLSLLRSIQPLATWRRKPSSRSAISTHWFSRLLRKEFLSTRTKTWNSLRWPWGSYPSLLTCRIQTQLYMTWSIECKPKHSTRVTISTLAIPFTKFVSSSMVSLRSTWLYMDAMSYLKGCSADLWSTTRVCFSKMLFSKSISEWLTMPSSKF